MFQNFSTQDSLALSKLQARIASVGHDESATWEQLSHKIHYAWRNIEAQNAGSPTRKDIAVKAGPTAKVKNGFSFRSNFLLEEIQTSQLLVNHYIRVIFKLAI
jgi:hypothetical protein